MAFATTDRETKRCAPASEKSMSEDWIAAAPFEDLLDPGIEKAEQGSSSYAHRSWPGDRNGSDAGPLLSQQ
jgi:hypothetical protein